MENAIWEYLPLSEQEKKDLWENAVFIFDTNVLLNLYRYSSSTRDNLLEVFSTYKDRIWIPYNVAYEYATDRCSVIYEIENGYVKLDQEHDKFIDFCKKTLRLKKEDPEIKKIDTYMRSWIRKQKEKNLLVQKPSDDPILNRLLKLFNNKVGGAYDKKEIEDLEQEGEERYTHSIPPGYKDCKKQNNKYGDFIIWRQIIDYARKQKKDVLYITADQKEDWWEIYDNKTVGPRVELKKEFKEQTEHTFFMYSMQMFLEIYSTLPTVQNKENLNKAVKEISQIQTSDDDQEHFDNTVINEFRKERYLDGIYRQQLNVVTSNMFALQTKISRKRKALEKLRDKYGDSWEDADPSIREQFHQAINNLQKQEKQLKSLEKERAAISYALAKDNILLSKIGY